MCRGQGTPAPTDVSTTAHPVTKTLAATQSALSSLPRPPNPAQSHRQARPSQPIGTLTAYRPFDARPRLHHTQSLSTARRKRRIARPSASKAYERPTDLATVQLYRHQRQRFQALALQPRISMSTFARVMPGFVRTFKSTQGLTSLWKGSEQPRSNRMHQR